MRAVTDKRAEIVLRSPLAGKSEGGPLQMREIVGQTLVIVRGDLQNEQFAAAFQKAADCTPPSSFNESAMRGGRIVFRLGPDEWLIRDDKIAPDAICETFRGAMQSAEDSHAAIINVSDYYAVIRIGGEGARDALAAGCPLDLHPRIFGAGKFAQSRFAAAAILLYQRDDAPTFDVQVRWSFAEYVREYLRKAGGA